MEEIINELKAQNEEYDSNFKTVLYIFLIKKLSKRFEEISLELEEKTRGLTALSLEKVRNIH